MDNKKLTTILAVVCGVLFLVLALTIQQGCRQAAAEKALLKQLTAVSDNQKAAEKANAQQIAGLKSDMGDLKKQQVADTAKTDTIVANMKKIKVPTVDEFAKKVVDAANCLESYSQLYSAFTLCKSKEAECDKLEESVQGERNTFALITTNLNTQNTLLTQNYTSANDRANMWETNYKGLYNRKVTSKFWKTVSDVGKGILLGYLLKTVVK